MLLVKEECSFASYNTAADNNNLLCILDLFGMLKNVNCLIEALFCASGYRDYNILCTC